MIILGIHGGVTLGQHDPAAALIVDGRLVACVEEERLIRQKSPRGILPIESIAAVLKDAGITMNDVDLVVHPGETYQDAPARISSYLTHYFGHMPELSLINHQTAHLASAYFPSGCKTAMVMSSDAFGDQLSSAIGTASSDRGVVVQETRDNINSLGQFYSTITSFLGFLPGEDEYKVMGLAAYGEPKFDLSSFAHVTDTGYTIDTESYMRTDPRPSSDWEPFYSERLMKELGEPRRKGAPITQYHIDVAASAQKALEDCLVSIVGYLHKSTGERNLCLAGGVALNCSANNVLRKLDFIDNLFVQPAASDRGLALGCALEAAYRAGETLAPIDHVFYGPKRDDSAIETALKLTGMSYESLDDPTETAAALIEQGQIVGWYQGRSEFGPRALGNRSILADPRRHEMKDLINARIKYREEFRPFAPATLEEDSPDIFEMEAASPFMTVAFEVRDGWAEKIPSVTHFNKTARVQTVSPRENPMFHRLISAFRERTGTPVVLNTSFNIKGQPIVETPLDALSTFAGTGLDAVIIGPYLVRKEVAPRA